MPTQCNTKPLEFEPHQRRCVVADFDGGPITSDAGLLLLRQVDRHLSVSDQVADCFTDQHDPKRIQYSLRTLIAQCIVGIAQGYEDLIDHDQLGHDPLMALVSEKGRRGDSTPLAGKSTLNRLEHAPTQGPGRYHKIDHDPATLQALSVKLFIQVHPQPPDEIILDLDATDDLLHGKQEQRFFHGYYKGYCYLPSTSFQAAICTRPCSGPPTSLPPPLTPGLPHGALQAGAANGVE